MMKAVTSAFVLLLLMGCSGSTDYGLCVGFGKPQDPSKVYELSTRNAVVTALFIQTGWAPVAWALEYAYCPVANKETK